MIRSTTRIADITVAIVPCPGNTESPNESLRARRRQDRPRKSCCWTADGRRANSTDQPPGIALKTGPARQTPRVQGPLQHRATRGPARHKLQSERLLFYPVHGRAEILPLGRSSVCRHRSNPNIRRAITFVFNRRKPGPGRCCRRASVARTTVRPGEIGACRRVPRRDQLPRSR